MSDPRRALPSVDRLLREPEVASLLRSHPRSLVVRAVRQVLEAARAGAERPEPGGWALSVGRTLAESSLPTLRRCINATGVVLHTNLGRAPLAQVALDAIARTAAGYSTLEYDLVSGRRGSRQVHCASLLTELSGAQDALVVNNAASALLLALAALATAGEVVVSRGELIEIGGGFRIPEILERSGASLVEVGTTNRTRLADYERALRRPAVRAILKVHRSNFRMDGFVAETSAADLVALGRRRRKPVLYDLGGGLMTDLSDAGLSGEPTVREAVRSGATGIAFSGDKLLGGPQAGVLLGTRRFVSACRGNPLARAVRADKLTLSGLAATLELYRDPSRARAEIPVLRLLTAGPEELERRAAALAASLPPAVHPSVVTTRAAVGGGAFPGVTIESRGVALAPGRPAPDELAQRLRGHSVPVVGTVSGGRVILDVRAILPGEETVVIAAVLAALER